MQHASSLFTACLITVTTQSLHADVITVDDDDPSAQFETIQAAVDASSDGDRIEVGPGYYSLNSKALDPVVRVAGKAIEIVATSGDPMQTIIAGQGLRRCVEWSLTTGACLLEGFTLDAGFAADGGGGLLIDHAALTVRNCSFNLCSTTGDGGAIKSTSTTVVPPQVINTRFTTNSAQSDGGAVAAVGGFDLVDCVFEDNTASIRGGGLFLDGNPAGKSNYCLITECEFDQCTALYGGGAYGAQATLISTGTTFRQCVGSDRATTTGWGGGLALGVAQLEMYGGGFYACEGGETSGGLDADQSTILCQGVVFEGNTGHTIGGGIFGIGVATQIELRDCTFTENQALEDGGAAIYCRDSVDTLTLAECTFDDNFAFGPTCIVAPNIVNAIDCQFNAQEGSILATLAFTKVELSGVGTGSSFTGCQFIDGESIDRASALRAIDIGGLQFTDCLFQNNHTTIDGDIGEGAVFIHASPESRELIRFDQCRFIENGACCLDTYFAAEGGALRVVGRSAEMTFCTLSRNTSLTGGALHGQFTLRNCSISGSTSLGFGGAAFLLAGSSVVECSIGGGSDCNYPWIAADGPITIERCTMTSGYPEGIAECLPDPDEIAGCLLVEGTTIQDTRFCSYAPAAIFGDWTDLGGNGFFPDGCLEGDVNGDGLIDGADLTMLLANWGRSCLGCPEDLDGNGTIDGADLTILLASWS